MNEGNSVKPVEGTNNQLLGIFPHMRVKNLIVYDE